MIVDRDLPERPLDPPALALPDDDEPCEFCGRTIADGPCESCTEEADDA